MNDFDTTAPMLAVAALRFGRNDDHVFGPLDFEVRGGEALLVTGGNGAGKTTLLRVLAGLLRAAGGDIAWHGLPCPHLPADGFAYVGHLPGHKADLDCLDNLRYAVGLHGCRADAEPLAALARVGLGGLEETPAGRLSAGQRKRLALARLLLSPARLWLLDEPYANLDRDGITLVDRLLAKHLAAGGAALVTTHGAYAAPPVRTRMLVLDAVPTSRAESDAEGLST